ncbi:hypothetical protein BaRGS_00014709 [Batillaria attramentaria]|uniref:FAS1 domain-containing protein n=1 Tax=Batillaria attramentaria TaxID=370345 RepID=A0ABD0L3F3_9CAEN
MLWLLVVAVAVGQCAGKDLVQTLVSDPQESTLVSLVTKAGLAPALSTGTHTVFAPNDAAFAKLSQATLDSLDAHPDDLANILKYHVVTGSVMSADLRNEETVTTLNGQKLRVNIYSHNHAVTVEGKKVIETDRTADNGVIHVVEDVIMPPSGDIVDIVAGDSRFSTLLTAVQKVGLADALKGDPLTVFAPTNDAFSHLSGTELQRLLDHPEYLKEVLTYHVIDHTL